MDINSIASCVTGSFGYPEGSGHENEVKTLLMSLLAPGTPNYRQQLEQLQSKLRDFRNNGDVYQSADGDVLRVDAGIPESPNVKLATWGRERVIVRFSQADDTLDFMHGLLMMVALQCQGAPVPEVKAVGKFNGGLFIVMHRMQGSLMELLYKMFSNYTGKLEKTEIIKLTIYDIIASVANFLFNFDVNHGNLCAAHVLYDNQIERGIAYEYPGGRYEVTSLPLIKFVHFDNSAVESGNVKLEPLTPSTRPQDMESFIQSFRGLLQSQMDHRITLRENNKGHKKAISVLSELIESIDSGALAFAGDYSPANILRTLNRAKSQLKIRDKYVSDFGVKLETGKFKKFIRPRKLNVNVLDRQASAAPAPALPHIDPNQDDASLADALLSFIDNDNGEPEESAPPSEFRALSIPSELLRSSDELLSPPAPVEPAVVPDPEPENPEQEVVEKPAPQTLAARLLSEDPADRSVDVGELLPAAAPPQPAPVKEGAPTEEEVRRIAMESLGELQQGDADILFSLLGAM